MAIVGERGVLEKDNESLNVINHKLKLNVIFSH
jgi:hypothetical protein